MSMYRPGCRAGAHPHIRRLDQTKTPMPPIEIYTSCYCSYCDAAKALLKRKGVEFTEIEIDRNLERHDEMIYRANGSMTVPQIFVGDVHVGGSDDLHALERAGKLDALLTSDKAAV